MKTSIKSPCNSLNPFLPRLAWTLVFDALLALAGNAAAFDIDTGNMNPSNTGPLTGVTDCSIAHWYTYIQQASGCTHINSGDCIWDPNWQVNGGRVSGRGYLQQLYYINCGHAAANVIYHARNTAGSDSGNNYTVNQCPLNGYYFAVNGAVGDVGAFSSWRVNASDASAGSSCGTTCGTSTAYQLGAGYWHYIGNVWHYINDWSGFGGFASSSVSDTSGRTLPFGEASTYVYPAVDTSHGNYFVANLYSGKTPSRVSGSSNPNGVGNSTFLLDFKVNAAAWGNGDNMDAYAFCWVNSPGGAGPKFMMGSDDGNRVWVNGTLINDNNSARGLTYDNDITGGIGLPAGWSRVLFKVHNGGSGFQGAMRLSAGNDNNANEGSVSLQTASGQPAGTLTYGLGYEQDAWYPAISPSSVYGSATVASGTSYYGNNTTVAVSGTSGINSGSPVPYWRTMQYMWGNGLSSADSNYADVSSTPTSTSWSHSLTFGGGHRRFHFFAVSQSGRTSFQSSGLSGGSTFQDSGNYARYYDIYVDNVAPVNPSFSSVTAASTTSITANWTIPLDQGVGVGTGSTETSGNANNAEASNWYRRGDVGVQVYRGGSTTVSAWSGSTTTATDTGLTPNTQYTYTLEARDNTSQSRGAWANSTGQQGSTAKYTLQVAATTPTFGTVTPSTIPLITTSPVNLTLGSSGVIFKRDNTTDLTLVQALTATDTGLSANTQHSYTARGRNGDGTDTAQSASASTYTANNTPTTPTFGTVTASTIALNTTGPVSLTTGSSGVIFTRNGVTDLATVQALTTTDSGLAANTSYSYTARALNANGVATAGSSSASTWTLSVAPGSSSVTSDQSNPGRVTWTAVGGFGAGTLHHYLYAFDQSATHTFSGSEAQWSSGMVTTVPTSGGTWYLHVQGFNGNSVANGTFDYAVTTTTSPAITTQPQPQTACNSSTATFTVAASGTSPSYAWYKHANAGWSSAWTVTASSGGTYLGSSANNNNGGANCNTFSSYADINTPGGNSLGLYGGSGGTGEALIRTFPASLTSGQVFQIDMDNGGVDSGKQNGFTLQNASGTLLMSFYFLGGSANYQYFDTSQHDTGIGFTRNGLRVKVIIGTGSPSSYVLLITACGGSTSGFAGTFATTGNLTKLVVYNNNTSTGGANDLFFNSIIAGTAYDTADNYSGNWSATDKGDTTPITGTTTTTYATSTGSNGDLYYAMAYNSEGVALSTNALLTVNPRPASVASGSATICNGGSTSISAALTGTGPWNVTWSDTVTQNGVVSSPATRSVSPSSTTTYTVTALTDANCTAQSGDRTSSVVVTVNALPVAPSPNLSSNLAAHFSMKVKIVPLLAAWTSPGGSTLSVASAGPTSGQGGTVSKDSNYIYYLPPSGTLATDTIPYTVSDANGCTAAGTLDVNFVTSAGYAQSIDYSGGAVTINFAGIPGYQYEVERSSDSSFTSPEVVLTTNAPDAGLFIYTDNSPPQPTAYYRLRH